jgi:hypothetical protein
VADKLAKGEPVTPAVEAWAAAYKEWWDALRANDRALSQKLMNKATGAWLMLDEPERQGAWAWYSAHVDPSHPIAI